MDMRSAFVILLFTPLLKQLKSSVNGNVINWKTEVGLSLFHIGSPILLRSYSAPLFEHWTRS